MPRTKRVQQSENKNEENVKPNKSKVVGDMINRYLKAMESQATIRKIAVEDQLNRRILNFNAALEERHLKFHSVASKTMTELKFNKHSDLTTISDIMSIRNISVNTTKGLRKGKNNSALESDSTLRSIAGSNIKKAKNSRISRAVPRNKIQQVAMGINSYTTPSNQNLSSASTFGVVTPKVKPNTPQVVLRRPKQGEIALSLQGSPLMVSSTVSDDKANVNIPLLDGRVLSIQPQRGLRTSQIPELDPETKRQIEIIRDNLNKVCASTARR